jgi:hypothetical protein
MFRINPHPVFTADVKVHIPGSSVVETLKATFRAIPISQYREYDLHNEESSRQFLTDIIVQLDELEDADGRPLVYDDKVRVAVLDLPHARAALARAYHDEVEGAARGNSDGPRGNG